MSTNWKLPEHLEPHRGFIEGAYIGDETVEELMEYKDSVGEEVSSMVDLLQRLYDAGRLK